MPWHLPEDLKRFKRLTMGHHIIMGRKTWESIGRLLPGRTTVIVTRNQDYLVPGAIIAHSLEEAIERCANDDEIFVIGGAEIYRAALPLADRLLITQIDREIAGDTLFPAGGLVTLAGGRASALPGGRCAGLPAHFVVYARLNPLTLPSPRKCHPRTWMMATPGRRSNE